MNDTAVYRPVKEQSHRNGGSTKKRSNKPDTKSSNFGHGADDASALDHSNMTASLTYRTDHSSQFLVVRSSHNSRTKQDPPIELSALPKNQQDEDPEELMKFPMKEEDETTDVDLDDSNSISESELLEGSMSSFQDDEINSAGATDSRRQENKSSLSSLPSLQSMTYLDNKQKREERMQARRPHGSWGGLSFSDDSRMDETYQNHDSISHSIDSSTDGSAGGGHDTRRSRKLAMCNLLGSSRLLTDDDESDDDQEELFQVPTSYR